MSLLEFFFATWGGHLDCNHVKVLAFSGQTSQEGVATKRSFYKSRKKLRHWTFEFWKERQPGGLGIRKILGSPKQCQLHLMGSMMIRLCAQQISFAAVLSINDAGKTRRSNSQRSVLQKVMHRWSWWQLMWYTMGRNSTLMDDPLHKITNDAHIS